MRECACYEKNNKCSYFFILHSSLCYYLFTYSLLGRPS